MDIRIQGSANFSQVRQEYAALQRQVASLNAELAATGGSQTGVNPVGYSKMQRAMRASSQTFRDAANSSGQFYAEQVKVNSATEHYTKLLDKQKLSARAMWKERSTLQKVYREQIALQNAYVRESSSMSSGGKKTYDIVVPTQVSSELNTINTKLAFTKALLESASTQMVNWGKNTQWAGRQLMVGFTIPTAAFGAATGVLAYQVDKEMTRIKKVYDTTTTAIAGDLESLKRVNQELSAVEAQSWKTAEKAARDYGVSAKDALSVQADLAATGLTGGKLQQATDETLRIATLGELDFKSATDMTVALQTAFRDTIKTSEDLTNAFNFMNATENATSLSIQDIAEATPRAASAMAALGVTVQQMTTMLVSMRESGVDAAEAANALKSATGTILAPSPAADAFIKQISNGRVQVTKLAEASGGNLYKAMEVLFNQMEGLGKLEKQQILVKLFGKYQFNRVSAMLYNMEDAFAGVQNQTSKSMELMGEDLGVLANTAEVELKRFQDSASGRFKTTLEELKVELAQMGKPFLEIGIFALKAAGGMAKFFNSLPAGVKYGAVIGAIFMALVGPITMLVGLTANFAGTFLKFITMATLFSSKIGLVSKESKAMELASRSAAAGFVSEASAVQELTKQLNILNAAQMASNTTARGVMGPGIVPNTSGRKSEQTDRALGVFQSVFAANAGAAAAPEAATYLKHANESADAAEKEAKARNKSRRALQGSAVAMGAMGAASTVMMFNSNETVDQIAQLALLAALVVPSFKGIGFAMATATTNMKAAWVASKGTAAAQAAGAASTAKTASRAAKIGTGLRAGAAGFAAMMGPVGWLALAVTAIGGGIFMWSKHLAEVREEQEKTQMALSNTTENWATAAGKVAREFERIQLASNIVAPDAKGRSLEDRIGTWKSEENKPTLDAIDELGTSDRQAFATAQFIDMQNRLGLSAENAAMEIKAMFIAAGDGAYEADVMANDLLDTIGKVDREQLSIAVDAQIELLNDDTETTLKDSARDLAATWSEAFARTETPGEAQALMNKLNKISETGFAKLTKHLTWQGKEDFTKLGIDSAEAMFKAMEDGSLKLGTYDVDMDVMDFLRKAQDARTFDAAIAQAVADANMLGGEFASIDQLLQNIVLRSKAMTYTEAVDSARELYLATLNFDQSLAGRVAASMGLFDTTLATREEMTLQSLQQTALAQGIKQGATMAEQMKYIMGNVKAETEGAASAANDLGNNLGNAAYKFTSADYKSMLQSAMDKFKDDVSEIASERFDSTMENAIDSAQAGWDKKIEGQQRRHEDEMDRFDARWDRRKDNIESYYTDRIDNIENAIEAEEKAEERRQAIFDAEMTRLDRMNSMANRNIDFNVALNSGDLDEAAKIRNDANAEYQGWALSDAAAVSEKQSNAKKDKLSNRIDKLDEVKEKTLKNLEIQENAERKQLERLQEMREKSLKEQADSNMKFLKEDWDQKKKAVDAQLELLKLMPVANQKQLKIALDKAGLSIADFGFNTADAWGKFFNKSMRENTRLAGLQIANSGLWEKMAAKEAKAILRGFGFGNMAQLSKFITTGKMPSDDQVRKARENAGRMPSLQDNHGGGRIGDGGTGRAGVARTQKGIHSSERLVRARKDEFMINEKSYKANAGLVEGINSARGVYDPGPGIMGGLGTPGIASAIAASMMMKGMGNVISNGFKMGKDNIAKRAAARYTNYGYGGSGNYSLPGVKPWVLEAANYLGGKFGIRTIGGVGTRSNASDHPSGHALDFMTSDVSKGDALANEIRKLAGPLDATYMIWRQRIDSLDGNGWKAMEDRGSPTANHFDHVHLSFARSGDTGDLPTSQSSYAPGPGGTHRPVSGSYGRLHDTDTAYPGVDLANAIGTPIYAVGNGKIVESGAYRGFEPRRRVYGQNTQDGYRSYGKYIKLALDAGGSVMYAHLNKQAPTGRVLGGSQIGEVGNTGYVYSMAGNGAHLHFGASNGNPLAYMKNGGTTTNDGLAYLHKEETVVPQNLSKEFHEGVKKFSKGPNKDMAESLHAVFAKYGVSVQQRFGKKSGASGGKVADEASGPGDVKTGTYNVKFSTSNKATRGDLKRLMGMADVLSLTEMSGNKNGLHDWITKMGWGWTGKGDSEVIWNKSKYNYLKGGSRRINNLTDPSMMGGKKRDAAYAMLQDKETNAKFWQIAAHTIPGTKGGESARHDAVKRQQWENLTKLYKELSSSGPVFLGGDLNQDLRRGKIPVGDMRSNWAGNMNGNYTMGSSYIDHLLYQAGISKLMGQQVVRGLSSDHNALLAQFNIPSLAKGGKLRFDNTLINGHADERMLTAENTRYLDIGLKNLANGANTSYNVTVNTNGDGNAQEIAKVVLKELKRMDDRLPGGRKG